MVGIKRTTKDIGNIFDTVKKIFQNDFAKYSPKSKPALGTEVFIVQINPTIQPSTNPPRKRKFCT